MDDLVDLDDLEEDDLDRAWFRGELFTGQAVETYRNGVRASLTWHPSGALAEETVFDDEGRPRTQRRWDEAGTLVGEEDWAPLYGRPKG